MQENIESYQTEVKNATLKLDEINEKSKRDEAAFSKVILDLERIIAFQKSEVSKLTEQLDNKTHALANESNRFSNNELQVV